MQKESVYYSVLWRKKTLKKNKTWDGDAILEKQNKQWILYDLEGQIMSKNNSFGSNLQLAEGETMYLGKREIEVQNVLNKEEFESGKCFTNTNNKGHVSSFSLTSKPYVRHSKTGLGCAKIEKNSLKLVKNASKVGAAKFEPRSRHDPSVADALVMPRPPIHHQQRFNKRKLPIVDVVIDPIISRHLRPHQKEGISFLYECVMGYRDFEGLGAILADEMGLGKSLQAIGVLWTLLKQAPYFGEVSVVKRAMIVCPATLVMNWHKEIKKWLGNERLKSFPVASNHSNQVEKKKSDCIRDFLLGERIHPVLIVGYERLRTIADSLKNVKFDLIVCDEGHRLKSANIKTTQTLDSFKCRRRIILSGTPIQNDLGEYFAMADFVNPGIFGTRAAFKRVFEDPIMKSRQSDAKEKDKIIGRARSDELTRITDMFVLRRTAEINQKYLPPKTEVVIFCKLGKLQNMLYYHILQNPFLNFLKRMNSFDDLPSNGNHLVCLSALRKLANAPEILYNAAMEKSSMIEPALNDLASVEFENIDESGVFDGLLKKFYEYADVISGTKEENQVVKTHKNSENTCINKPSISNNFNHELSFSYESSGKLIVLRHLLKQIWSRDQNEKVVIVSNFTQTLSVIGRLLDEELKIQYFRLDGTTPSHKRIEMVDRFNRPTFPVSCFLLSSKSGGTGLNLIGANRLILFEPDWNPANDKQAMARVWRDGQKKPVWVYRLVSSGCIDEKVFQRGMWKSSLSQYVMKNAKTMPDKKLNKPSSSKRKRGRQSTGNSEKYLSIDELRQVFSWDESGECETHQLIGCHCAGTPWLVEQKETNSPSQSDSLTINSGWKHILIDSEFSPISAGDGKNQMALDYVSSLDECLQETLGSKDALASISFTMIKCFNSAHVLKAGHELYQKTHEKKMGKNEIS